ncbi:hypothetical protein CLF_107661, partial [Clonorchis sinensis]
SPIAGLEVHIELVGVRLLPEYEDVAYTHNDNGIVLDTSRRSNMHHWRAPLQEVLNNWCRHPLPIQYYLTMHPYLDRHTTARRQTCINPMATGYNHIKPPLCPSNVPHKSTYFHRSINGQCTQNNGLTDLMSELTPQLQVTVERACSVPSSFGTSDQSSTVNFFADTMSPQSVTMHCCHLGQTLSPIRNDEILETAKRETRREGFYGTECATKTAEQLNVVCRFPEDQGNRRLFTQPRCFINVIN